MRLLMLVPHYAPDLGPSAPLFTMLGEELVRRGHQVTVIAAVPHYPTGKVPDEFCRKWIQRTRENGVDVIRVRIPSVKRVSLPQRLLQFLCYQLGATWAGIGIKCDVAFVANPALWVWLPFFIHVALKRKPAMFSVQDVYPDVGITLGIFRHKPVIQAVASLEQFCLNHSSKVQIISESFKPGLRALGVSDSKMALVYNWADKDMFQTMPRNNAFSREFNLTDCFVVLYAGNIGLSQGLENVLTAAEHLEKHKDIRFVFVGDGTGKEQLHAQAEKLGLKSVQFIPFQPRPRLREILASADLSLIMLKKGVGTDSLPSKTCYSLGSGLPVVASLDEGSETWNVILRSRAGLCVPPENPEELSKAILTLKQDDTLRKELKCNGRLWAEQYFSPQVAIGQIEELLLGVCRT